ncbi:MAG: hypothetical protein E7463_09320 [Ruminococcaceae bacterium]|nr:hypothetical protein [Oscillospiraceae bacterium]
MNAVKENIRRSVEEMKAENLSRIAALSDAVSLTAYRSLVRTVQEADGTVEIWTDAFQAALRAHEIIRIPARPEPYCIDASVIVPSNRRIEAENGAVIRQMKGVRVLMLRNEHVQDGTHAPISGANRDCNISITGGRWEESYTGRAGYGRSGMIDEERSFFGVSACMFFNNIENLTITDVTFANTAGFAVQVGDIRNAVFENITFDHCFADGLHINGNTENVLVRDIRGEVGDDLVALNMYDWLNSSVNFGPTKNVLCENLDQSESGSYRAMRILPGVYYYDDGSAVDCSANDLIIRNVRGVNVFKMYFQTPVYVLGTEPERGGVGSGDHIFFEDISIDLSQPADMMPEYLNSDPVRGCFGAFEINANLGTVTLENIDIKLYKERYPLSYLVSVGPKSTRREDNECFDPYLSSTTEKLILKNVTVNGRNDFDIRDVVREVSFDDINADGHSTGAGKVRSVEVIG